MDSQELENLTSWVDAHKFRLTSKVFKIIETHTKRVIQGELRRGTQSRIDVFKAAYEYDEILKFYSDFLKLYMDSSPEAKKTLITRVYSCKYLRPDFYAYITILHRSAEIMDNLRQDFVGEFQDKNTTLRRESFHIFSLVESQKEILIKFIKDSLIKKFRFSLGRIKSHTNIYRTLVLEVEKEFGQMKKNFSNMLEERKIVFEVPTEKDMIRREKEERGKKIIGKHV